MNRYNVSLDSLSNTDGYGLTTASDISIVSIAKYRDSFIIAFLYNDDYDSTPDEERVGLISKFVSLLEEAFASRGFTFICGIVIYNGVRRCYEMYCKTVDTKEVSSERE